MFDERNLEAFVEVTRAPSVRYLYENNSSDRRFLRDSGPKKGHECRMPSKADPL